MKHIILFLSFFLVQNLLAQDAKKGGFIYNWTNYSDDDITGLGNREVIFDSTGLADIIHAPAVGVHPRIYFGPSEIPDIRIRLANSKSGQSVKSSINAYANLLNLGTGYNQSAEYAKDEFGNRYIDNSGAWNMEPFYSALKNEDPSVWNGVPIKSRHRTAALMTMEAFLCLMYPDDYDLDVGLYYSERAENLAKAMHFWATLALEDPEVVPDGNKFNNFGGTHMALCYDLLYNKMTLDQRDTVRLALAKIIPDLPRHGGGLHAYANTSNWSTLNSFEIITNLAIEGEPGYQAELTARWMRALHNFITYGWYPSGAGYEGLGKNYQFVTTMIAAAKRGYSLLAHPHVRAYGEEFLPAIMQPFGKGFTSYDVWGGSGYDPVQGQYKFNSADIIGLKYAFPNSPSIDFVWRNYIGSSYVNSSTGYVYAPIAPDDSYNSYLIPAAIFCSDYDQSNDWQTQADELIVENYVATDRGLAVFKSGTKKEDLAVQFHARQDMGGHTHGDRLDFTLSGLERVWIRKSYGGSQFQPSKFHSMVLINDLGVAVGDPDGDKCRQPATILDYSYTDEYAQISADATYPYKWEWHWSPQSTGNDHPWLGNNGWEKVTRSWNDFLFEPQSESHFDIPFYEFPHWHQENRFERMVKREYNSVEKVVRNIGLLKGDHPMLLVIDDVKKDDNVQNYKWTAQLARDLEVVLYEVQLTPLDYRCDIILKEPEAEGNRRLLVRVLDIANYNGTSLPGYVDTLDYVDYFTGNPYNPNPNWIRKRLVVESNSVSPNFKVLLFPHNEGDELPTTNWNTNKDTLEVVFSDDEKVIHFYKDDYENTQFEIVMESVNTMDFVPQEELLIYPNPSQCQFNVKATHPISKVELYNSNGLLVKQSSVTNLKTTLVDTKDLPAGIYQLKVQVGEETIIERVVSISCKQ